MSISTLTQKKHSAHVSQNKSDYNISNFVFYNSYNFTQQWVKGGDKESYVTLGQPCIVGASDQMGIYRF